MAEAFSIPPYFVADSMCDSFSYGKGPTIRESTSTTDVTSWNGTESAYAESPDQVHTSMGTAAVNAPAGGWTLRTSGPAATSVVDAGIGRRTRQVQRMRPPSTEEVSTSAPLAITFQATGAVTTKSTAALSLGSSTVGNQYRARSGQLSPNSPRWPLESAPANNPSAGDP